MANTFKFGNGNWAVKDGYALAYNDENNNFKPLPFDFTRASSATRVNKQGLVEAVPSGKPRIDFLDNTSGHLLLEPSRTNIMLKSEEIDSSYWLKTSATITANDTVSPNGEQTSEKFNDNGSGTGVVQVYQNRVITTNQTHTFSIFAKKGTVDYISLRNENFGTPNNSTSYFNISNGTLGTVDSDHTAKIIDYGNGWYRCSITLTFGSDNYGAFIVRLNEADNTPNVVRNGAKNVYLWGGQIELGNYTTSYIKTDTSSVTRSDDYAIDAGNSDVFSNTELSWFLDIEGFAEDGTDRYISISDNGGSPYTNGYNVQYRSDGNLRIFRNGLDFADAIAVVNIDQAVRQKIAIRYKQNDMKVYINGTSQTLNSSYVFQSMSSGIDSMRFTQQNSTTSNAFDGKIYEMRVWNEALTDTELQNLTS